VDLSLKNIEARLKEKLSTEDYELASQILNMPSSRVRSFIEQKIEEASK